MATEPEIRLQILQRLASYVPPPVLKKFAKDGRPLINHASESCPGIVLMADISGYTRLTEHFAKQGPVGAEEIRAILNTYFNSQSNIIHENGGDIIRYVGDGLLALWLNPPWSFEPFDSVCMRAVQCAVEMQETLNDYETAGGVNLRLHIGLGVGKVVIMIVGGELGWECLVGGEPLCKIATSVDEAKPGETVVDRDGWELVKHNCFGTVLPSGAVRVESMRQKHARVVSHIPITLSMESAIRSYVPSRIQEPLDANLTNFMAELRRVSVLFVSFPGIEYAEGQASLHIVQTIWQTMQRSVYNLEGFIKEFSVDDKGSVMVAAFGIPPQAHEDDPLRAISAAMEIVEAAKNMGLSCSAGVTTGQAFCGSVGCNRRQEYAVIGDTVNLSARLMAKAGKEGVGVLCDNYTQGENKNVPRIRFESLGEVRLKGKEKLVPIFRPYRVSETEIDVISSAENASTETETKVVGRLREREHLLEQVKSLWKGGNGGVIIIEGDAGTGKSILVKELRKKAEDFLIKTYYGAGDRLEKNTSYFAWRSVLAGLFELRDLRDPESRRTRIKAMLQDTPELLALSPLLNAILPLDLSENERTLSMSKQVRGTCTRQLLLSLLKEMAARSTKLIIVEDLHLLDSASWALLLATASEVSPLLLVLSTRPISGEPDAVTNMEDYQKLISLPQTEVVRLEQMSIEETDAVVASSLGVEMIPEEVKAIIRQKGQGNPFFVSQIAYTLRDTGYISAENGQCRILKPIDKNKALPDTLQGIMLERIDRLSQSQQVTLKVAAVIGRVFEVRLLSHIHPMVRNPSDLQADLRCLHELDIITPELTESENYSSCAFRHAITQEVAYNQLLFAHRRKMHRSIAEWYEQDAKGCEDLSPYFPLLAHHWVKAEDMAKSFFYLERSGNHALDSHANQEAVKFFSEALKLDENMREQDPGYNYNGNLRLSMWRASLGRAYLALGNVKHGKLHLERALSLSGSGLPSSRWRLTLSTIWQSFIQLHLRLTGPPRHTSAQSRQIYTIQAQTLGSLFETYYFSHQTKMAINVALKTINKAEKGGLVPELSRGLANMSVAAESIRLHGLAASYNRLAGLSTPYVDMLTRASVLMMTASQDLSTGSFQKAKIALERAAEITEELGDRRRWEECKNNLGLVSFLQGDFRQSATFCGEVFHSGARRGDVQTQSWGLLGQARSLAICGQQLQDCMAFLEVRSSLLREQPGATTNASELNAAAVYALAYSRLKNHDGAEKIASPELQKLATSTPSVYLCAAITCLSEVHFALYELKGPQDEECRRNCRQIVSLWKQFSLGLKVCTPHYKIACGQLAFLEGRNAQARKYFTVALDISRRMGMSYQKGLANYYLAKLTTKSSERQQHLDKAAEIFLYIGAEFHLQLALVMGAHGSDNQLKSDLNSIITGSAQTASIHEQARRNSMRQKNIRRYSQGFGLSSSNIEKKHMKHDLTKDSKEISSNQSQSETMIPVLPRNENDVADTKTSENNSRIFSSKIRSIHDEATCEAQAIDHSRSVVGLKDERDFIQEKVNLLMQWKTSVLSKNLSPSKSGKATRNCGSVIIVEGEPGFGKAHLIIVARDYSEECGLKTVHGCASPYERTTPYFVWRSIFFDIFELDLPHLLHQDARRAHVLSRLQQDPMMLSHAPLLNSLVPLNIPETSVTRDMSSEDRLRATHQLLLRLIEWMCLPEHGGPLMVVVEKAHWMDGNSWALVASLSHAITQRELPVLFVLSTRPLGDQAPQDYTTLLETAATHFQLRPLSYEETKQLITIKTNARDAHDSVTDLIYDRAQGHPFFTEQLIHSLQASNSVIIRDGICCIASTISKPSIILPDSIHRAIISRIDMLSPSQQLTLKVASVIGGTFDIPILKYIHPGATANIEEDIRTLESTGFIIKASEFRTPFSRSKRFSEKADRSRVYREEDEKQEELYLIKQEMTQELVYSLVSESQRKNLHHTIAEWYEYTKVDNIKNISSLLANHWSKAGNEEKARYYRHRAYELSHSDANTFIGTSCLEPGSQQGKKVKISRHLSDLSDVLRINKSFPSLNSRKVHITKLENQLDNLNQILPNSFLARKFYTSWEATRQMLSLVFSRDRNLQPANEDSYASEVAQILLKLTELYANEQHPNSTYTTYRAANFARSTGASSILAQSYTQLLQLAFISKRPRISSSICSRAETLSRRLAVDLSDERVNDVAEVLYKTGAYRLRRGELVAANSNFNAALALTARVQEWTLTVLVTLKKVELLLFEGEFISALSSASEAHGIILQHLPTKKSLLFMTIQSIIFCHLALSETSNLQSNSLLRETRANDAKMYLSELKASLMHASQSPLLESHFYATEILVQIANNELVEIENAANTLVKILEQRGNAFQLFGIFSDDTIPSALTTLLFTLHLSRENAIQFNSETASKTRTLAYSLCQQMGTLVQISPILCAKYHIHLARLHECDGNMRKAKKELRKAQSCAAQMRLGYDLLVSDFHILRLSSSSNKVTPVNS